MSKSQVKKEVFGVMLDCSRNAVMSVEKLKFFIDCLEKMGYNALELYTEDTYELQDEPYFGYLRGRYTPEEIREVDAYAKKHGVELIPCIQTLAHFTAIDRGIYRDIIDNGDILLIDEPKTYEFLEKIFESLSKCFSSRKINIGMDEAHFVGRGKYQDLHGFCDKTELLVRHLNKVSKIAEKYGFKAHMWSDMFFRLVSGGVYYNSDAPIPDKIMKMIPSNVHLCYWDYYHTDKSIYDSMLKKHKEFGCEVWFAGGSWTWGGFAPMARFTINTMKPAMQSVNEQGIKNVLITMWGDDGAECSVFSQLHTLYAIRQYANGNFDQKCIEKGFYKLFGVKYSDFMLLDIPNLQSLEEDQTSPFPFCKPLLYCDPLMGMYDLSIENRGEIPFENHAKLLKKAGKRAKEFKYIFDELSALCFVLEVKYDLGVRTKKAYLSGDKEKLKLLLKDYDKVYIRLQKFHAKFFALWHNENKPFGWEIQDARIGGLMQRIKTCMHRLQAYIAGDLRKIEELEAEILPDGDGYHIRCNTYKYMISKNVF